MDGQTINRRALLGSQIVQLKTNIPEVEKLSRKTPPKTLKKEWEKVHAAIELLPKLQKKLSEMEEEYEKLHGKPVWFPQNNPA